MGNLKGNPYYVKCIRTGAGGEMESASVHKNMLAQFQSDGWLIAPEDRILIPVPELTELDERIAEDEGIDLSSESSLRDDAAGDPVQTDKLFVAEAVKAARRRRKDHEGA